MRRTSVRPPLAAAFVILFAAAAPSQEPDAVLRAEIDRELGRPPAEDVIQLEAQVFKLQALLRAVTGRGPAPAPASMIPNFHGFGSGGGAASRPSVPKPPPGAAFTVHGVEQPSLPTPLGAESSRPSAAERLRDLASRPLLRPDGTPAVVTPPSGEHIVPADNRLMLVDPQAGAPGAHMQVAPPSRSSRRATQPPPRKFQQPGIGRGGGGGG